MLRIDASKLTLNADKAYYNNVLFSGIAFTCNDTQVLLENEYLNGDNIGEYRGYLNQRDFKVIYLREKIVPVLFYFHSIATTNRRAIQSHGP